MKKGVYRNDYQVNNTLYNLTAKKPLISELKGDEQADCLI